MRTRSRALAVLAFALIALPLVADDDDGPKPAPAGTLVVVDAKGKEQKVAKFSFTAGTRRLGWLAAADKDGVKGKGPEVLVIRDAANFGFLEGVVAYVPFDRVRAITFDNKKGTVSIVAAATKGTNATLVGSTAYKGINKFTLEADVDKGEDGVASLKFQGGTPTGIEAIRFPEPKLTPAEKGARPAVVQTIDQRYKRTDTVTDLRPLYRFGKAEERLASVLMFKKTLKLDVAKIKKIAAGEPEGKEIVWRVTQKDGDESSLTLLTAATIDGKQGTLIGLVGKLPYGWRFFPVTEITAIDFDVTEVKDKKKDAIKADTE